MRCRQDRDRCCLGRLSPPLARCAGYRYSTGWLQRASGSCAGVGSPGIRAECWLGFGVLFFVGFFFLKVSFLAIIDSFVSHLGGWQAVRTAVLH